MTILKLNIRWLYLDLRYTFDRSIPGNGQKVIVCQRKLNGNIIALSKEVLDGKVPHVWNFFTNMDDNIYEYCMKH